MAGLVSRVSFEGLSVFELWPCPFFIGDPLTSVYNYHIILLPYVQIHFCII